MQMKLNEIHPIRVSCNSRPSRLAPTRWPCSCISFA